MESAENDRRHERREDRERDRIDDRDRQRRREDRQRSDTQDRGRYNKEREERGRNDERERDRERHRVDDRNRERRYGDYRERRERDDRERREGDRRDGGRNRNDDRSNRRDGFNRNDRNRRRSRSRSGDDKNHAWGKPDGAAAAAKPDKPGPNFGLSGKLTEETNTYRGVVIKYSEPPEARKPRRRWRLYPFKEDKSLPTLYIHRESAYLIGRDRKVVDLPVDHPSCSKQHAALQYRLVPFTRADGSTGKCVKPYLIDLESANGTFLNNQKVEPKKYIELKETDVIKFGYSKREYVLLHENSKDEALDDDVKEEVKQEIKEEEKDE